MFSDELVRLINEYHVYDVDNIFLKTLEDLYKKYNLKGAYAIYEDGFSQGDATWGDMLEDGRNFPEILMDDDFEELLYYKLNKEFLKIYENYLILGGC